MLSGCSGHSKGRKDQAMCQFQYDAPEYDSFACYSRCQSTDPYPWEAFPSYPKTTPPKSFIWSQLRMMLLKLWIEHEQKQVEKAKNIWCHHALEHPGHTLVTERSCPMKKIPGLRSVGLQCMKFVKHSFSIHLKGVCWNWKECEQFVLRHLKKKKKKVWHKND